MLFDKISILANASYQDASYKDILAKIGQPPK